MVQAMRERDRQRKDALSFLLSELKTTAINKRVPELADAEAISLLQKQLRQREESRDVAANIRLLAAGTFAVPRPPMPMP